MSTELHRWRKAATTDEWAQLAKLANTTPVTRTRLPTEIAGISRNGICYRKRHEEFSPPGSGPQRKPWYSHRRVILRPNQ